MWIETERKACVFKKNVLPLHSLSWIQSFYLRRLIPIEKCLALRSAGHLTLIIIIHLLHPSQISLYPSSVFFLILFLWIIKKQLFCHFWLFVQPIVATCVHTFNKRRWCSGIFQQVLLHIFVNVVVFWWKKESATAVIHVYHKVAKWYASISHFQENIDDEFVVGSHMYKKRLVTTLCDPPSFILCRVKIKPKRFCLLLIQSYLP